MIQVILIVIAIFAFSKETISVTKNTEVIRPKTFIVGSYALLITLLSLAAIPKIAFYLMLISLIILIWMFRVKKQTVGQQDKQL